MSSRSIAVHPFGTPTLHPLPGGRYAIEVGGDVALVFADFEALYLWTAQAFSAAQAESTRLCDAVQQAAVAESK